MKETIQQKLKDIEREQGIEILLAVESGSRAWGFPSKDSDFDVRFIYRRKRSWYLQLQKTRDTLEFPINDLLDISGWDLDKTLLLLRKTNPSLIEWLRSPIVYYINQEFVDALTALYHAHINERNLIYHYLHMAKGNFRTYLQGDTVKIKKYFYVLRPILACMWIERYHEAPPMEFTKLLELDDLNPDFLSKVGELLRRKMSGEEMDLEPSIPVIYNFIDTQLDYFEKYTETAEINDQIDYAALNQFFLDWTENDA
jgi:predicted nucleotidyltransferase